MGYAKNQAERANGRIDMLIKDLGLFDYESLGHTSFYSTISPNTKGGILHEIVEHQQEQINALNDTLNALLIHLNVIAYSQKAKVTLIPVKKGGKEPTSKRKYVKSGKYSKKTKNV